MYRLIYPTPEVPLQQVVRAALAQCGADNVAVVTGAGSQAVRVPEECADRTQAAAGLSEGAAPQPDQTPPHGARGPQPEPEQASREPSGSGAQPPRAATARKTTKKTAPRGTRSKEG